MIGNIWEWCNDWFSENDYEINGEKLLMDPQGRSKGQARVVRGGSFINFHWSARCAYRHRYNPYSFHTNLGFRVVVFPINISEH